MCVATSVFPMSKQMPIVCGVIRPTYGILPGDNDLSEYSMMSINLTGINGNTIIPFHKIVC